jgi:hypothetical protein
MTTNGKAFICQTIIGGVGPAEERELLTSSNEHVFSLGSTADPGGNS